MVGVGAVAFVRVASADFLAQSSMAIVAQVIYPQVYARPAQWITFEFGELFLCFDQVPRKFSADDNKASRVDDGPALSWKRALRWLGTVEEMTFSTGMAVPVGVDILVCNE